MKMMIINGLILCVAAVIVYYYIYRNIVIPQNMG